MKAKQRIRFRVTEYASDKTINCRTDEVLDGVIVRSDGEGWLVAVTGQELPYYVTEDDICERL